MRNPCSGRRFSSTIETRQQNRALGQIGKLLVRAPSWRRGAAIVAAPGVCERCRSGRPPTQGGGSVTEAERRLIVTKVTGAGMNIPPRIGGQPRAISWFLGLRSGIRAAGKFSSPIPKGELSETPPAALNLSAGILHGKSEDLTIRMVIVTGGEAGVNQLPFSGRVARPFCLSAPDSNPNENLCRMRMHTGASRIRRR